MAWRKADNWTAFTDGSKSWLNGPSGLQDRLNDLRFCWEADAHRSQCTSSDQSQLVRIAPSPTPTPTPTLVGSTAAPSPSPTPTPTPILGLDVPSFYPPAGWMGDTKNISLDAANTQVVHSPAPSSIRFSYQPGELGWAGVYFLPVSARYPQGNWGDEPGFDLRGARRISFWARGEHGSERVEFKAGGVRSPGKPYSDSFERSLGVVTLSPEFRQYSLDLAGADFSSVLGAFAWVATKANNPSGLTFYLSEITYEGITAPKPAARN